MYTLRLLLTLTVLLATSHFASASPAGPATAKTDGEWIEVSGDFMAPRLAVPAGAMGSLHRVVVDVPHGATPKNLQAKVTRSCGDEAIDAMAVDYVRTAMRYDKRLAANLGKYTLAFQLELRPYVAKLMPVESRPADVSKDRFWTPLPIYPYYSLRFRESGIGKFRITFGSKDGRPLEAVRIKTSGSDVLDANTVLWVLNHWYAPVGGSNKVMTQEVEYTLR